MNNIKEPSLLMKEHKDIWFEGNDYDRHSKLIQRKNATILANLHVSDNQLTNIFELGCGTGNLTEQIVALCGKGHIDALDISKDMIGVARKKQILNAVNFICSPFLDFIPTIKYDAIFSNAAFHWLYPMYLQSLKKIESMLSDGGLLYMAVAGKNMSSSVFDAWIDEKLGAAFSSHTYQSFSARRLSIDDFKNIVASTSLELKDAFILERSTEIKIDQYVDWLISSGAFWDIDEDEVPKLREFLIGRLSGNNDANHSINMGHWSLFVTLKK